MNDKKRNTEINAIKEILIYIYIYYRKDHECIDIDGTEARRGDLRKDGVGSVGVASEVEVRNLAERQGPGLQTSAKNIK